MSRPIPGLQNIKTKRKKEVEVVPPKFIMKIMSPKSTMAVEHLFYCKNHLLSELTRNWGSNDKCDIIVQQFIASRSTKACIHRFYRNEKNVYRVENLVNKKSVKQYEYAMTQFRETVEEVLYDQRTSRSPR